MKYGFEHGLVHFFYFGLASNDTCGRVVPRPSVNLPRSSIVCIAISGLWVGSLNHNYRGSVGDASFRSSPVTILITVIKYIDQVVHET